MITQYFKTLTHFHFTYLLTAILIFYKIDNKTWEKFIRVWLYLSIIINIFGIYQIIARAFDLPFAWIELTNASFFSRNQQEESELIQLSLKFQGFFRATSFFSEPSALGAFNGITLIFTLIPKFKNFKPFIESKKINTLIIILAIIGLLLAFSLTGVTIVAIIIIMLIFTEKIDVLFSVLKVLPIIVILVFISNYIVESYTGISILELFGKRFGTLSNLLMGKSTFSHSIEGESVVSRGDNFRALFNIWLSSPIIGVGLGLTYLSPYANGWVFSDTSIMAVLAEMGIIGFIPYISIFIVFYYLGFRITYTKSIYNAIDDNSKRLITLIIYLMSYLVVTNFLSANNLLNYTSALFFAFIISITNNYYIDYEKKYYIIKFVSKPLKSYFYKNN